MAKSVEKVKIDEDGLFIPIRYLEKRVIESGHNIMIQTQEKKEEEGKEKGWNFNNKTNGKSTQKLENITNVSSIKTSKHQNIKASKASNVRRIKNNEIKI